jgi:hypothetical protein
LGTQLASALILAYTTTAALLGSIFGIALGTTGTQVVSTVLRWMMPNVDIAPFLRVEQAPNTLINASSLLKSEVFSPNLL